MFSFSLFPICTHTVIHRCTQREIPLDSEIPPDSNGNTISSAYLREQLIHARRDGDITKVKDLLEVQYVDLPSCHDEYDNTPLYWASYHGHLDIVK